MSETQSLTVTTREAAEILGWPMAKLQRASAKGQAPKALAYNAYSRKMIMDFANTGRWGEAGNAMTDSDENVWENALT